MGLIFKVIIELSVIKKLNSVLKSLTSNSPLSVLFKFLIAAVLISFIIYTVNLNQIILAIKHADFRFIAFALLLAILNVFLQYLKWSLACGEILQSRSRKKILFSLFYGLAAGPFTPVRIGEYLGRSLEFQDQSLLRVTTATLIDKAFTLIPLTLFGSICSILFIKHIYNISSYIANSLFGLVIVLFLLLILLVLNPEAWSSIISGRFKKSSRLNRIYAEISLLRSINKIFLLKMFLVSTALYLCIIFQYAVLVTAFSQSGLFLDYLWAGSLVIFVKTIIPPISFADLGIREGASVFFLKKFGQLGSIGFDAGISLFAINVLLPALIGVVLFLKKNND